MAWVPVELGGGQHLARVEVEGQASYSLHLTNLANLWVEEVGEEQFQTRWNNLNSDLEGMAVEEGLAEVVGVLPRLGEVATTTTMGEEQVEVELQWVSEGLPMRWQVVLVRKDLATYSKLVTTPLLSSLASLLTQRAALAAILRRKDMELEDLRGGGATLSLPHLATPWFHLHSFLEEQRGEEVVEPLSFLSSPAMVQLLQLPRGAREEVDGGRRVKEVVDSNASIASTSSTSTTSTSSTSPAKLSSKRVAARPDLSKIGDKASKAKRARLGLL